MPHAPGQVVQRTQTGVRIEESILAVLKSLATLKGMTLGELLEGIVLHAFEGKTPFGAETLAQIDDLKRVFGMRLTAEDSHQLRERAAVSVTRRGAARRARS